MIISSRFQFESNRKLHYIMSYLINIDNFSKTHHYQPFISLIPARDFKLKDKLNFYHEDYIKNNPSDYQYGYSQITYSIVYSFSPTGIQNTNCMALQSLWNSVHSSTLNNPLAGGVPYQTGSAKNSLIFFRIISYMVKPQHNFSLVNTALSVTPCLCCKDKEKAFYTTTCMSKYSRQ